MPGDPAEKIKLNILENKLFGCFSEDEPPGFPACEINPEESLLFSPQNTLEYWRQFVLASEGLLFIFRSFVGWLLNTAIIKKN